MKKPFTVSSIKGALNPTEKNDWAISPGPADETEAEKADSSIRDIITAGISPQKKANTRRKTGSFSYLSSHTRKDMKTAVENIMPPIPAEKLRIICVTLPLIPVKPTDTFQIS